MKKALKAKWVSALRSGLYKQTQGTLHRISARGNYSYCCLGVLCEISPKIKKLNGVEDGVLIDKALDYAGFTEDQSNTLQSMNDDGGHGFKRIATWIEKNL
jgi:hypothetical protein